MLHFSRHPDTLAQCGVRVNGFADVYLIITHFNGQCYLANHVACMLTSHATEIFGIVPTSKSSA